VTGVQTCALPISVKDGVREVATAVASSSLATIAVFLPLAFVGGMVGEIFVPFAVTSSLALGGSLIVALTITPVLCYWFLRPTEVGDKTQQQIEQETAEAESAHPCSAPTCPSSAGSPPSASPPPSSRSLRPFWSSAAPCSWPPTPRPTGSVRRRRTPTSSSKNWNRAPPWTRPTPKPKRSRS